MSELEFLELAKSAETEAVRTALSENPTLADVRDNEGVSALMWALYYSRNENAVAIRERRNAIDLFEAASLGDVETLVGLLAENPNLANVPSPDGFHPLGLAAYFGQEACIAPLLAAGANPNLPSANTMKFAPLHSALGGHHYDIAKALVRAGADVNLPSGEGWTSLHYAADLGDEDMAQFLMENGGDPTIQGPKEMTPSEFAIHVGHDHLAEILSAEV